MKRYQVNFPFQVTGVDFETLENSKGTVCTLDADLLFTYFNPAWVEFARENGVDDILIPFPLNSPLADAIGGKTLKDFYVENYKRVLANTEPWHHDYECSSKEEFRQYHQSVYPFHDGTGLLVINSLAVTEPMENMKRKAFGKSIARYRQSNGFITQCSNCRHTQRAQQPSIWDWVPAWIEKMPKKVSHSICPICFDYYYKYYSSIEV